MKNIELRRNGKFTCLDCKKTASSTCASCKNSDQFELDEEVLKLPYEEKLARNDKLRSSLK